MSSQALFSSIPKEFQILPRKLIPTSEEFPPKIQNTLGRSHFDEYPSLLKTLYKSPKVRAQAAWLEEDAETRYHVMKEYIFLDILNRQKQLFRGAYVNAS